MRLLIVFSWRGNLDFLYRTISEREDGRMQEQGEWRKRKKREDKGSKKKEKKVTAIQSTCSSFAKVGAALLIRTDATHRANEVW